MRDSPSICKESSSASLYSGTQDIKIGLCQADTILRIYIYTSDSFLLRSVRLKSRHVNVQLAVQGINMYIPFRLAS